MFDNFFGTVLLIIGVSIIPALTAWAVFSDLKKHYNNGFEDGYKIEMGYNAKHGRPKGIASESKYNSGFIDGQIKAREDKSNKRDLSTKNESIGAELVKHMEEFRSNKNK